jgi:hypothetical protein
MLDPEIKKAGRPSNIKSVDHMIQLFEEYVAGVRSNPILVEDYVGKDGIRVHREKQRPLTMEGFKNFCWPKVGNIHQYLSNQEDGYPEYLEICNYMRSVIRQDQIEGGMAGIYNPSITQRLNNLTERTENINTLNIPILSIDPLSDELDAPAEIKQIDMDVPDTPAKQMRYN